MQFKLKTQIGDAPLEVNLEARDEQEFFEQAQFWYDLPKACGNCGKTHLVPVHRQPKGYEYYEVKCRGCYHSLKYGITKEKGQLFPKGWEAPQAAVNDQ